MNAEICKNLKVDDRVLVSMDGYHWYKRHYAEYHEGDDTVTVWYDGGTSWSTGTKVKGWRYIELPEDEEDETVHGGIAG